jgi:hypothetical protein
LEFSIPSTTIEVYKLMPICPKEVKVYLEGNGDFSVYWDSIREYDKPGRKLIGLTVTDRLKLCTKKFVHLWSKLRPAVWAKLFTTQKQNLYKFYVRLFNYFSNKTKTSEGIK